MAATGAPITFVGTGEHLDDLDAFDARSFVGRMLGMGDIKGLIARLQVRYWSDVDSVAHVRRVSFAGVRRIVWMRVHSLKRLSAWPKESSR